MIVLVYMGLIVTTMSWTVSGLALQIARLTGKDAPPAARVVFHELRPLFVVAAVTQFLISVWMDSHLPWGVLSLVFNLVNWRFFKDEDDDDRWKRRRDKLAERVQVFGGRLAVVPVGGR